LENAIFEGLVMPVRQLADLSGIHFAKIQEIPAKNLRE
jgi:hypothetical protein